MESHVIVPLFATVREQDVLDFESHYQITLPDRYRQFLLKYNGGRPVNEILDVPGWPGQATALHYFFGVRGGPAPLGRYYSEVVDELPAGFFPIGIDQGGNFLCLGTTGEHADQIWYWDSTNDYDLSECGGTMFKVGDNIDEVLRKLKPSQVDGA